MAEDVRAAALYSGWVQGVGFRYTTRRVAGRFAVTGFVRNLPDATVEIVAEGSRREILAFLAEVRGAMKHYVDSVVISWCAATGEFSGFSVRF